LLVGVHALFDALVAIDAKRSASSNADDDDNNNPDDSSDVRGVTARALRTIGDWLSALSAQDSTQLTS
jgi:hypothetical protein